jgi:membrane protease YdiL (CAAX protease family)
MLWWWNGPLALSLAWPLHTPMIFLLVALIYPVLEELVFRGALQGALYRQPWGRRSLGQVSLANLLTSLVFAGFHLFYHAPLWAALVLFPSLIFGYFRDRYQSVVPAIVLHVFYNAGYFWLFPP